MFTRLQQLEALPATGCYGAQTPHRFPAGRKTTITCSTQCGDNESMFAGGVLPLAYLARYDGIVAVADGCCRCLAITTACWVICTLYRVLVHRGIIIVVPAFLRC